MTRLLFLGMCVPALAALPAAAQSLADPTRPPVVVGRVAPPAKAGPGPVLQAVLISPQRRSATISGKVVALGERFGPETLVRVNETEVALLQGSRTRVLKLFPNVNKTRPPGDEEAWP